MQRLHFYPGKTLNLTSLICHSIVIPCNYAGIMLPSAYNITYTVKHLLNSHPFERSLPFYGYFAFKLWLICLIEWSTFTATFIKIGDLSGRVLLYVPNFNGKFIIIYQYFMHLIKLTFQISN